MIKKAVTMSDIARSMNVSTVTVSKALGDREGVSDALREKIKQKASEMGYKLRTSEREPRDGSTYNIGIVVAKELISDSSAIYWTVYKDLIEIFRKHNYYGMLEVVEDTVRERSDSSRRDQSSDVPNSIRDRKVDGIIMLGQFSDEFIDKLSPYFIPTVFLDYYGNRDDTVIPDNFYGAYTLTSHLISNGHRRIAFLGSHNAGGYVTDRYLGYYKALLENRIALRSDWTIPDRDRNGSIFKLFTLPEEMPTAFVCACDETAFRLVDQLSASGIRVPTDISVVGFENHTFATMCRPNLTTVDINVFRMAEEAADILLKKIRDGSYKRGRTLVSGSLVRRDSVRNLFA